MPFRALFLFLAFPYLAFAQEPPSKKKFETYIQQFEQDATHVQGGAMAIVYKDQVIYQTTFGFKKDKTGSVKADTLFPLASSSKPISAALIAYLIQQKKLHLDDTIKSFPKLQLRHFLSHSTGYPDPGIGDHAIEAGKHRQVAIKSLLKTINPAAPGTSYSYSNVLYATVDEFVAEKTGESYEKAMGAFLAKVGINDARICHVTDADNVAYPHKQTKKGLPGPSFALPQKYPQTVCPSAGLFLSIDDLVKMAKLFLGQQPKVLALQDLAPFFQSQVPAPSIITSWRNINWPFPKEQIESTYGLGWRILKRKNAPATERLVFHSGYINGIRSFIGLIPESQLAIAVVVNQDTAFAIEQGLSFWREALK